MGPSNGKVRITFPYSVKSIDGKKVRLVGAEGFEPPALCSQSRCATRLRYAPTGTANLQAEILLPEKLYRRRMEPPAL
jgi:hypothetical protein